MRRCPSPQRGATLIELMLAMGILAFGLLAMWHMHMFGITSTAAGRRHTVAAGIARELLSGIEQLPFAHPLVADTGATGPVPPATFGRLVDAYGNLAAGAREWDEGNPIPGVRLDATPEIAEARGYRRRWTVWGLSQTPGGASGVKVIGASVTWEDPPYSRRREVVEYTFLANPAMIFQNLAANL
jgi:hypothetical protein